MKIPKKSQDEIKNWRNTSLRSKEQDILREVFERNNYQVKGTTLTALPLLSMIKLEVNTIMGDERIDNKLLETLLPLYSKISIELECNRNKETTVKYSLYYEQKDDDD